MSSLETAPTRLSRRNVLAGSVLLLTGCNGTTPALPSVSLPPIAGLKLASGWAVPGIDTERFRNRVTLLNVWAAWCPYCQGEHSLVGRLRSEPRVTLAGLVHQDTAENARAYLRKAGNPYAELSVDSESRLTKPLGQGGVPHTYVIGRDLTVVATVPGALTAEAITSIIRPGIQKALAERA